jgi:hypothetical protein
VTALLPRRLTLILTVVALMAAMIPAASPALADTGAEGQFVSLLNQERAAKGLPKLSVASDLTAVARRHSQRMADGNNLHHNPNLGSDVSGWQKVGENVGRGPSAGAIHQGFMNSPSHAQNILDSDWTQVGVGVVVRDGQVWVTEVFRLPSGATSQPAPEPKPEPEPATTSEPTPQPAASEAPKDEAPASAPEPSSPSDAAEAPKKAVEEEPEPEGPRHEVTEQPTGLDRGLLTLARLEAREQGASISDTLED